MYRNDLILRLNCIPQNMTCEGVKGALNEPPFWTTDGSGCKCKDKKNNYTIDAKKK